MLCRFHLAFLLCCSALILSNSWVAAQEPAAEEAIIASEDDKGLPPVDEEELTDPADADAAARDLGFAPYVNLELVAAALDAQDPRLLTDAALQLAHGERALHRPHASLDSGRFFRLAYQAALRDKDQATLTRIAAAARDLGKEQLLTQLEASAKLAGASRAFDSALLKPADDSPEAALAVERFQGLLGQLERARAVGDREQITDLAELLPALNFDEKRLAAAKTSLTGALAGLPEKDDPKLAALKQLMSASRGEISISSGSVKLADNLKVYSFAKSNLGKKVGTGPYAGECAMLAVEALKYANCKPRGKDWPKSGDYVWGTRIGTVTKLNRTSVKCWAGDILQFRNVKFSGKWKEGNLTRTQTASYGHHTAIVGLTGTDKYRGKYVEVYHQNVGPAGKSEAAKKVVQVGRLYFGEMTAGTVWIYCPIPNK